MGGVGGIAGLWFKEKKVHLKLVQSSLYSSGMSLVANTYEQNNVIAFIHNW